MSSSSPIFQDSSQSLPESNAFNPKIGVLLLHGLTGNPSEMRALQRRLSKEGYSVDTPMLPGHGKGHPELLATGWKDWLAGAKKAYQQLASQNDRVYVAGLSVGSSLAIMLAVDPDIQPAGIVILSPSLGFASEDTSKLRFLLPIAYQLRFFHALLYWSEKHPYGLKDERLQRLITRSIESAKKGETREYGLFRTYLGSLHQNNLLVKAIKHNAHRVTCPAIIIQSLEDTIMSVRNATHLGKILGSKDKSVVLINGCDHVMTVDLRKHDISEMTVQFIRDTVARHSAADQSRVAVIAHI